MASESRPRPVRPSKLCVCEIFDAGANSTVNIDTRPARDVADAGDRGLVINVAQVALSVRFGSAQVQCWFVEKDAEDARVIHVMFKFPAKTCFTHQQLELIKLVNTLRVREVWVQPEDTCVYVGAALWRSDTVAEFTVQDVVIIRRVATAAEAFGDTDTASAPPLKRARA
jgi:hypothetical protein